MVLAITTREQKISVHGLILCQAVNRYSQQSL